MSYASVFSVEDVLTYFHLENQQNMSFDQGHPNIQLYSLCLLLSVVKQWESIHSVVLMVILSVSVS